VLECAAIQDVLVVGKALAEDESRNREMEPVRMAAMLSRLGGEDTGCVNRKKPAAQEGKASIPIPIPIAIWMRPSPNKALTLRDPSRASFGTFPV
jgi:hypothetical protein